MIQIRQDMAAKQQRARALGLDADELAFYDAVAVNFFGLYDEAFLRDLIHDVVRTVKNNLKVDWTEPHREDVKATVRAAVRKQLRCRLPIGVPRSVMNGNARKREGRRFPCRATL